MTVDELKAAIEAGKQALVVMKTNIEVLEHQLALLISPFGIGQMIAWKDYRGQVERIKLFCGNDVELYVRVCKKDGSLGERVMRVLPSWDKPRAVEAGDGK
jgi:hypothetical protein